ncbi:hypothetical protein MKX01_041706 [Papaver californicum]|nr:hypothetical protein MKX01_041706 [Papaver californicum]
MLNNSSGPSMLAQGGASSRSGDDVDISNGWNKRESVAASSPGPRKRNHKVGPGDDIVEAMLEIAAASKMRATIKRIYFFTLDLFENLNATETFISLKSVRRVTWLQGKSSSSISRTGAMI